jgi:GNAT superfamily N-acetyltransferase
MVNVQEAGEQAATVGRARTSEAPAMARVLARAFYDDPAFSWVLRSDPERLGILERGFDLFLRRIWMEQEETYTTAGTVAVAVWERPDEWKLGVGKQLLLAPAMMRTFGRHLPRLLRALMTLEAKHPHEPHYYLPFVGVDPEWQGRGLGGAVLAPVLERCDAEGMPAFLEASTPRNRALYERHGFAATEEFTLGEGAPPQWRMWRAPAPRRD